MNPQGRGMFIETSGERGVKWMSYICRINVEKLSARFLNVRTHEICIEGFEMQLWMGIVLMHMENVPC